MLLLLRAEGVVRPAITDSDFVWGVTARGRSSLTLDGILTDRSFILEADEISSALKKAVTLETDMARV